MVDIIKYKKFHNSIKTLNENLKTSCQRKVNNCYKSETNLRNKNVMVWMICDRMTI